MVSCLEMELVVIVIFNFMYIYFSSVLHGFFKESAIKQFEACP